jgi:hypothetical protein
MSLESSLKIREFLEQFFGKGNQLTFEKVQKIPFLQPWITRLERGLPTVLPCARTTGTDWYGLAFSEQQFRGLREELAAFVGPTWSSFRGQRAALDSSDPIEAAVWELTQGKAFKFQGSLDETGKSVEIQKALSLMTKVLDRKTGGSYEVPRATGRVLRDFYTALRVGDRSAAERDLQYLRSHNRLDVINLLFLQVQMLAELQSWTEVLRLPDFPTLLSIRRPPAVTQAIIQTIYQCELSQFEPMNATRSAVAYFQEVVLPKYGTLYTNRAGSRLAEVVKSFMLVAIAGEAPNPALRDELLAVPGLPEADQLYLQNLAKLLPSAISSTTPSTTTDVLEEALQAAEIGNYDYVLFLLQDYPPSQQTVRLLLEAAYELQTLESERVALQSFDQLPIEAQAQFQSTRRNRTFLESLIGRAQTTANTTADLVPTNWLEWLSILNQNPEWERASYSARQGAQEWDVAHLLDEPGEIAQFLSLQSSVTAKVPEILQDAFPHLLSSFQKDPNFPRREFLPLYAAILDTLVFGIVPTGAGEQHFTLFNELVTILLNLGVNAQQCNDLLDYALDLWSYYQAPSTIDWGLDVVNIFVLHPCADRDKRSQLLFKVAEGIRNFANRIDEVQRNIFHSLARDLKLEASFPDLLTQKSETEEADQTSQNIFQKLKNKAILIYTLTEPVAQRVKSFLENTCEGITVHLSHDKGGSDRLRRWVKNDDLVVIVTASAKHAATGFIEEHRQNLALLRVNSKGSASLLREIQGFLSGEFSSL